MLYLIQGLLYDGAKQANAFLVWLWGFLLIISPWPYTWEVSKNSPIKRQIFLFLIQWENVGIEIQIKLWLIFAFLLADLYACADRMWEETREALNQGVRNTGRLCGSVQRAWLEKSVTPMTHAFWSDAQGGPQHHLSEETSEFCYLKKSNLWWGLRGLDHLR